MKPEEDTLLDPHVDGVMEEVHRFAQRNASRPEQLHRGDWVKNGDGTYSRAFHIILGNGAETSIISKKKISEREYFKRKLKYG